jgi:hypothetical protein
VLETRWCTSASKREGRSAVFTSILSGMLFDLPVDSSSQQTETCLNMCMFGGTKRRALKRYQELVHDWRPHLPRTVPSVVFIS